MISWWEILNNIFVFVWTSWWTEFTTMTPLMRGVILQVAAISILVIVLYLFRKSRFGIAFSLLFENMYEFFEEVLWRDQKRAFKIYIVTLFFIILTSNLLWYIMDLIRVVFIDIEALPSFIAIPTTSFNFNLALAWVSVFVMLYIQFRHLGIIKFFLEYLPITGKWILKMEKWTLIAPIYYPLKFIVTLWDIAISLFVWILDIIGIWAKVISLTSRLYGNMLAWWILLWLLISWVNLMFQWIFADWFPLIWPLILYIQWLLVALIQAFVFPLLIAIFIKIAVQEAD